MAEFAWFLLVALGALVYWTRGRLRELEARIAALTERVFYLESGGRAAAPAPPPPFVRQAQPPVLPPALPPLAPPALGPLAPIGPPARDLEAVIGGNWLSKLGVLMLLIGVALFLGFSLTEMGPMGRILTGAATGLALLGAGLAAERKAAYRMLGSALIGGGWAGVYFTAFAAHGIEASRVIDSPGVGFFLLLAVAGGMILHSLRYRNQTVTGLAFAAAYLTIAISSLTLFSAIASIPLLIALLVVSWKFGWQPLAAAGALLAYGAYGFDLATGDKDRYFVAIGEPVLWTYWLILEAFDLAAKRRGATPPLAPLNLTGFLFATAAVWPDGGGWKPDGMLAAMAAAQFVSAMLRGRWNGPREIADDSVFGGFRASITYSAAFSAALILDRFTGEQRGFALALLAQSIAVFGWLFRNSYLRGLGAALFALPLLASGAPPSRPVFWTLTAMFLLNRLFLQGGLWYSIGAVISLSPLLIDFEPRHARPVLLTIAAGAVGLALRLRGKAEARWIGLALAVISVIVMVSQIPKELLWVTLGVPAALYVAFGWALPEGVPRLITFFLFQFFAGALLYRLLGQTPWLMAGWLLLCLGSWAAGLLRGAPSLAASVALLETVSMLFWSIDIWGRQMDLAAQALGVAALFGMYLVPAGGHYLARTGTVIHGVLAAVVTTGLLQDFVSGRRLTLAWSIEAFLFLALGIAAQRRQLRLSGLLLFGLCLGKLFFYDFAQLDTLSRIFSFIVLGLLLIAASWAYSRFREQIKRYL